MAMDYLGLFVIGSLLYLVVKILFRGFYVVNQNERAVKTVFGRAQRIKDAANLDSASPTLTEEEKARYNFPKLQEGANQVSIITNTAEREAAIDFGKASAIRPNIVGKLLNNISQDPDLCEVLFDILEINRMVANKTPLYVLPDRIQLMLPTNR
jgi:hypothetical protein